MTDLEQRLLAVAELIPIPPAEPFREQVLGRIATPRRRPRKLFMVVAAALVTGSLGALPGPRGAFARWLGFDSVRIVPGPLATAPPTSSDASSTMALLPELGPAVSIGDAEQAWGLPVQLPSALGEPTSVHVVDQAGVVQVVAVYPVSPTLPEPGALGVALRGTARRRVLLQVRR